MKVLTSSKKIELVQKLKGENKIKLIDNPLKKSKRLSIILCCQDKLTNSVTLTLRKEDDQTCWD